MESMNVPTPQQELSRGNEAAQLLDSPAFQEASSRIREGIMARMKTVPISDDRMQAKLILLLQCWESIESYLQQSKQTGKFAAFQIEEERKRRGFFDLMRDLRV
jgi:hypothetical protein